MTRKSISTGHAAVSCDVCGRTLLRGEHHDAFIAGGSRRMVCELCTGRAANEGWIREGADAVGVRRSEGRGRRSLLGRLRSREAARLEQGKEGAPHAPAGDDPDAAWEHEPAWAGYEEPNGAAVPAPEISFEIHTPLEAPTMPPAAGRAEPAPASAPREPRHVRAVPTNAELKMSRALDVFNAGEHTRTVSGIARSLGAPVVAVRPSPTEGSIVTIAVGWELCWYRYEVDLADEAAGVRVVGQGSELHELEAGEQEPNAAADERGRLELA